MENKKSIYSFLKNTIIFIIFAIFTSCMTASINELTKNKINNYIKEKNQKNLNNVLPIYLYDKNIQNECYYIKNNRLGDTFYHRFWLAKKNNKIKAVAIELFAEDGYSGLIKIILGTDIYGNILGVRVIEHHETPGLGDKIDIDKSNWIANFSGIHIFGIHDFYFQLKKYQGKIDSLTSATITSLSVVKSIKKSVISIVKISSKLSKFNKYEKKINL